MGVMSHFPTQADTQRELAALHAQIRHLMEQILASAGSDPSFETNRELKLAWATELAALLPSKETR